MRKNVEVKTTKTVEICDVCEKNEVRGYQLPCVVCGKVCCYACGGTFFFKDGKENLKTIDIGLSICLGCRKTEGRTIQMLEQAVCCADRLVYQQISRWRENQNHE